MKNELNSLKIIKNSRKFKTYYFIFFALLSLIQIKKLNCQTCSSTSKIKDGSTCFNEIIKLNKDYWSGQITIRNDGNLFIEYSSGSNRLFYGLKPNGRGLFSNEATTKILTGITKAYKNDGNSVQERYESRNILISFVNDPDDKQYIFSISSYYGLTELHYFGNEGDNSHKTWLTTKFLNIDDEKRYIFSHQFSLVKGDSKTYYIAFIQYKGTYYNKDYSDSYSLSKFKFNHLNNYEMLTKEFSGNYNNRIVSAIRMEMDDYNYLAVFFLKSNPITYTMRLHNLDNLDIVKDKEFYSINDNAFPGQGIFFKAIYLRYEYVAFIFFTEKDQGNTLKFRIKFINKGNDYSVDTHNKKDINGYELDTSITLNEFYKIDDEKLLYVSNIKSQKLILMFFDTFDWYKFINIRTYKFDIEGFSLDKELRVDYYNSFLILSSSIRKDNSLSSILLFFSHPNGTDFYMNISPYVMDSGYYITGNNLINELIQTRSIDNNIFDYEAINEIKLVSIPNEIIFYRDGSNIPLENGGQIGINHKLYQNKNLIKYDQNYTLDYQFIAIGLSSYDNVYNKAHDKEKIVKEGHTGSYNFETDYTQKIYYGRTNRLTFRLCHEFCETCKELGNNINNQKCVTCKSDYKYDYYNYFNIYPSNCVPEGYFNDIINNNLVVCSPINSNFYYNITDNNKRICFDKDNECPDTYHYLNITNNECLNYTPPITTIPAIITTVPKKIPITIIEKIPTTIIKMNPTTYIEKVPTTIIDKVKTTIIEKVQTTIIEKVQTTIIDKEPTTIITSKPTTILNPIITTVIKNDPTTILNEIKTTTISTIPYTITETNNNMPPLISTLTTFISTSSTTILTTNPLIKSTLPDIIPQTMSQTNNFNIPTSLHKFIPISSLPNIITSKIQEIIPSNKFEDKCLNGTFITNLCSNVTNEELYSRLKTEIFDSYNQDESPKIYNGNGDYSIRVSNTLNEMKYLNGSNGLSLIDLGECEYLLKITNNIPLTSKLIIIKKEKNKNNIIEKDIQYEIYNPISFKILNLSICDNITIDLYVPLKLSETKQEYYKDLAKQGYNPFDLNDKFYKEICTPYVSENGTDVLLDEREEFIFSPIAEQMVCQNNCVYSSYSLDTNYIKCECGNNMEMVTLDIKHLSKENILQSFLSTFVSTNYKVMRCYNLVFNFKIFCKNIGSIITLIFFIIYIISMIYYFQKGIQSLKIEISKILFNPSINEKTEKFNNTFSIKKIEKIRTSDKVNQIIKYKMKDKGENPPKKIENSNNIIISKNIRKNKKINIINNRPKSDKINNIISMKNSITEKKILNIYDNENISKLNNNNNNILDTNPKNDNVLDNFELNDLDYDEACELDKRGFCMTYWSVLLREHILLFTFLKCNDYNLFYIKIIRFLTLLCIEMTFNGLFFVHESMHRKYVNNEDFTFVQKIPQLLFTLIVSHIIEVILCFMGMTDSHLYKIKELSNSQKNGEQVINIIEKMKHRLIGYFIFTFLLFAFNWYFISAFCAVYQNTQIIFLRDTGISFLTSMIDPFIIYGITTMLRYISLLSCCKKKLGCVYKLSDLIPIF